MRPLWIRFFEALHYVTMMVMGGWETRPIKLLQIIHYICWLIHFKTYFPLFLDIATGKQRWGKLVKQRMLESLGSVSFLLASAFWFQGCNCGFWNDSFGRRSSYRYCFLMKTINTKLFSQVFEMTPTLYSFSSCGSFHVSLGFVGCPCKGYAEIGEFGSFLEVMEWWWLVLIIEHLLYLWIPSSLYHLEKAFTVQNICCKWFPVKGTDMPCF